MWDACFGDAGFFVELCEMVVLEFPPVAQTLHDALGHGDAEAARGAAHQLKGMALQTNLPFAGTIAAVHQLFRDAASRAETQQESKGQNQQQGNAAVGDAEWAELQRVGRLLLAQVAKSVEDARMVAACHSAGGGGA